MPQVKVIQPIAEQEKKLRVAAYARVSSDSADQLNSFATQVGYYTSYIQSKEEWEFAGLYADEAVTGTAADKRDDFQRLLADCRAGRSTASSSNPFPGLRGIPSTVSRRCGNSNSLALL